MIRGPAPALKAQRGGGSPANQRILIAVRAVSVWLGGALEEDGEHFTWEAGYSSHVKAAVSLRAAEGGDISPADIAVRVAVVLYGCCGGLSLTLVVTDKQSAQ